MPNFSVNQGGFGSGKTASDAPMYLAVFEEWADGSVSSIFIVASSLKHANAL